MAIVYIIYSSSINRFYIGSCVDFIVRLEHHITGYYHNAFTLRAKDWVEYLLIDDLTFAQARYLEQCIKRKKSKVYIQNLKKYPDMLNKLVSLVKRDFSEDE